MTSVPRVPMSLFVHCPDLCLSSLERIRGPLAEWVTLRPTASGIQLQRTALAAIVQRRPRNETLPWTQVAEAELGDTHWVLPRGDGSGVALQADGHHLGRLLATVSGPAEGERPAADAVLYHEAASGRLAHHIVLVDDRAVHRLRLGPGRRLGIRPTIARHSLAQLQWLAETPAGLICGLPGLSLSVPPAAAPRVLPLVARAMLRRLHARGAPPVPHAAPVLWTDPARVVRPGWLQATPDALVLLPPDAGAPLLRLATQGLRRASDLPLLSGLSRIGLFADHQLHLFTTDAEAPWADQLWDTICTEAMRAMQQTLEAEAAQHWAALGQELRTVDLWRDHEQCARVLPVAMDWNGQELALELSAAPAGWAPGHSVELGVAIGVENIRYAAQVISLGPTPEPPPGSEDSEDSEDSGARPDTVLLRLRPIRRPVRRVPHQRQDLRVSTTWTAAVTTTAPPPDAAGPPAGAAPPPVLMAVVEDSSAGGLGIRCTAPLAPETLVALRLVGPPPAPLDAPDATDDPAQLRAAIHADDRFVVVSCAEATGAEGGPAWRVGLQRCQRDEAHRRRVQAAILALQMARIHRGTWTM